MQKAPSGAFFVSSSYVRRESLTHHDSNDSASNDQTAANTTQLIIGLLTELGDHISPAIRRYQWTNTFNN
jgi:hypothetical protein